MLSQTLVDAIGQALQAGKKVYLYLNQRGAQHCLICRDCGHIWRCPDCDHVLRVHREPEELLVCHLCSRSRDIPATCDRCQSSHLASLGSRIQSVTRDVQVLFPKARVVRVESTQKSEDTPDISEADIIIGTNISVYLDLSDVDLIGVLLVEAELSVAQYDIEEQMYHSISFAKRSASQVVLQTYDPDLPIVQDISAGNFKNFFGRVLTERKKYGYPPFCEMVRIWVEDKNEKKTRQLAHKLVTRLHSLVDGSDIKLSYHEDQIRRFGALTRQDIVIRGTGLGDILQSVAPEILRNRGVWMEWL